MALDSTDIHEYTENADDNDEYAFGCDYLIIVYYLTCTYLIFTLLRKSTVCKDSTPYSE